LKGVLIFCGVVVTFGLVWSALSYRDARDREYEHRLVGALNFTEDAIGAALDLRAGIYGPSIAPGPNPDYWVVSGLMVSKDNLGGTASAPFSAVLENVCAASYDLSCWRTVELAIDGQAVDALPLVGVGPDVVAEGAASGNAAFGSAGQNDIREEDLTPVPAVLNGGEPFTAPEYDGLPNQDLIRFIQNALTNLRYEPGPIDGKLGSRTASAIRVYQRDSNLVPDGLPSVKLLRHLRGQLGELGQQSRDPSNDGQPSGYTKS
jgi:hypothetical protein